MAESVHTYLMFQNGRALEALRRYEEIFEGAFTIDELDTYDDSAAGLAGQVQLAVCTLLGQRLTCIDSPVEHTFVMTPAISLFVECSDDDELERLFGALSQTEKSSCRSITTASAAATAGWKISSASPGS
jgi:predicted 3-demethylubiquinone-9 3-methyltransferase (glyoxalase superfamily)